MSYVDGFVVPVPKSKLDDYRRLAEKAGKLWKQHGALEYVECVGDDVPAGEVTSFPKSVQLKPDEVVVFSWIVYKSRRSRPHQQGGDGGSLDEERSVDVALRRQADVYGWVQAHPRGVIEASVPSSACAKAPQALI
jgi:uncharacterized protein YbaA (DUF1428 family)